METPKFKKSVLVRRRSDAVILVCAFVASLALNIAQYDDRLVLAYDRDRFQWSASMDHEQNLFLGDVNRFLESRLKEMTEVAGYHRSFGVYHDCVQQNLGIYQMREVERAYDQFFRTTELSAQCLAESAWYKTHPIGINPEHLNH